jgi:quinol monooxygenase YgiN
MLGDMSGLLIYVDTSDVREGAVEELRGAIKELVEFIDANEPQIVAYGVHLSDDEREMTVVHVHVDPASLEYHLDVAGPAFRKLADLITLSSIRIYGEPSERALTQLHDKARRLGRDDVAVHGLEAGFSRIGFHRLRSPTG